MRSLKTSIEKQIIRFHYNIQNITLNILSALLFRSLKKIRNCNKIVIFRTGYIGDNICAAPAIKCIREKFPQAKITLLVSSNGKNNLALYNLISKELYDNYIDYYNLSRFDLLKQLRNKKVDLYIELPQTFSSFSTNLRNLLFAKFLGAKHGMGWQVYSTTFIKKTQALNNYFTDETNRLLSIIKPLNIKAQSINYKLNISESDIEIVNKALGTLETKKNIGIVIGAKRSTNRYPIENFKIVLKYFSKMGKNLIIIGGPEDKILAAPLLEIPNTYDFTGALTPMQSAFLLSKCSICISNDTGPLHLAYAMNTPVVGIFSNRDYPKQWYPPKERKSRVLRMSDIPCEICLREECNFNNFCTKNISPNTVIQVAEELLTSNHNDI